MCTMENHSSTKKCQISLDFQLQASLACPIGGQADDLSHDLCQQLRPQAAAVPAQPYLCMTWACSVSQCDDVPAVTCSAQVKKTLCCCRNWFSRCVRTIVFCMIWTAVERSRARLQVDLVLIWLIFCNAVSWAISTRISTVCRRSCSPCTGPRSSGCLALCLSMGCTVAWCTSSLLCITRWSMRCSMRQGSKIRPRGFLGRGVSFQRKGDAPAPTSRGRGGRRRSRDAPAFVTAYRMWRHLSSMRAAYVL